jgi:hypothetical protein
MRHFEHDGWNLAYEEAGHGAPVLLVHGLGPPGYPPGSTSSGITSRSASRHAALAVAGS